MLSSVLIIIIIILLPNPRKRCSFAEYEILIRKVSCLMVRVRALFMSLLHKHQQRVDYIFLTIGLPQPPKIRRKKRKMFLATSYQIEIMLSVLVISLSQPRSGELRTQKLKSHLVRTQSLNVLPFKPGVGQYKAIHATLTARNYFLAYFYPSGPFTCIFSKTSPNLFLCWLWLTPDPV